MKLAHAVILSGILHNCIRTAFSCSPPKDWLPLKPTARVRKADIVIYGTVRASPRHGPKKDHEGLYSALFEVHCTFKGGKLPKFINVSGFGFAGGLCTHSAAYLNKTYITFIRRDAKAGANDTQFFVNEVNVQSATIIIKHKLGKLVLKDIVNMVGNNAALPLGATKDSWPGCPTFANLPSFHPTTTTRGTRRHFCHHRSHKHKKRRHKKCRVSSALPSTQIAHTTTELASSRRSYMSSKENTKASLLFTTARRKGNVEFLFNNHSSASRTQSFCWCFVLIFHGLVLVVVKWHQTWFMALLRQGKQVTKQRWKCGLIYVRARRTGLHRGNYTRLSLNPHRRRTV